MSGSGTYRRRSTLSPSTSLAGAAAACKQPYIPARKQAKPPRCPSFPADSPHRYQSALESLVPSYPSPLTGTASLLVLVLVWGGRRSRPSPGEACSGDPICSHSLWTRHGGSGASWWLEEPQRLPCADSHVLNKDSESLRARGWPRGR